MDRRTLLRLAAGGLLATPLTAAAQQRIRTWRVGFLSGGGPPPDGVPPLPLRQALQALGYTEQHNVIYLSRWANAKQDRLPGLAAELVGLKVDVIVTVGGPSTAAAKEASPSLPVVMALVGDADGLGLIDSLARPGGNVTGVTDQSVDLSAKRLEIITEALPRATRIAVLWNADDRGMTLRYREVERAARRLHVTVQPLGVREPDDFDMAFSAMTANRPDALIMVTDALTLLNRKRVIDFALVHRIPAMYEASLLVQDGGLMSYGANQDDKPHHEHEDRQGTRLDDPAGTAAPRGSGDRVTEGLGSISTRLAEAAELARIGPFSLVALPATWALPLGGRFPATLPSHRELAAESSSTPTS